MRECIVCGEKFSSTNSLKTVCDSCLILPNGTFFSALDLEEGRVWVGKGNDFMNAIEARNETERNKMKIYTRIQEYVVNNFLPRVIYPCIQEAVSRGKSVAKLNLTDHMLDISNPDEFGSNAWYVMYDVVARELKNKGYLIVPSPVKNRIMISW